MILLHFRSLRLILLLGTAAMFAAAAPSLPRLAAVDWELQHKREDLRPRLTTVDWESYHEHEHEGNGTYSFGYDVQDPETGNVQFREESRDKSGTVRGSYGILEPDGNVRIVHYIADNLGFRVEVENSLKPDEQHPQPMKRPSFVHNNI